MVAGGTPYQAAASQWGGSTGISSVSSNISAGLSQQQGMTQPSAGNLYQPVAVPAMPVKTQSVLPSASLSQVQSDKARAVKSSFQLGAMMM